MHLLLNTFYLIPFNTFYLTPLADRVNCTVALLREDAFYEKLQCSF